MSNRKLFNNFSLALALIAGAFSVTHIITVSTAIAASRTQTLADASPVATAVESVVTPAVASAQVAPEPINPVHLIIPNARVNADIIPVGVTKTNNLDVPPNFVQVGWYKNGPMPGAVGNAVLDGHVDNGGSIDGVFKHLRDLKIGDDIYITGDNGRQLHFKVTASDVYLTTEFPSDRVFNQNNGQSILKIITCHGTYVPSMKTYDHRLVVTAVLVTQ